ncbi:unnamed protein product [Sphagnum jensenii]|uniref:Serine/threonine-protein phosphatase 4 regulatory subunit 2 n=1 Tax=Sphagnum jensenii TaxID=128206 RepID=A0ABP1B1R4_9BRYO
MQVFIETLPCAGELSSFCKQDASKREFSPEMRSILEVIAATGQYWHNWEQLKTLLSFCLKQVLQDYYGSHVDAAIGPPRPLITGETFQQLQDRLDSALLLFTEGAPFTIQRLCEVLLNPRDAYPNLDKVALAFEKLLLVTSTVPASVGPYPTLPLLSKATDVEVSSQKPPDMGNSDVTANATIDANGLSENKLEETSAPPDEDMVDVEAPEVKKSKAESNFQQPSEEVHAGETVTPILSETVPTDPAASGESEVHKFEANQAVPLTEEDLADITMGDGNSDLSENLPFA